MVIEHDRSHEHHRVLPLTRPNGQGPPVALVRIGWFSWALVAPATPAPTRNVDGPAPTSADEDDRTRTNADDRVALTSR